MLWQTEKGGGDVDIRDEQHREIASSISHARHVKKKKPIDSGNVTQSQLHPSRVTDRKDRRGSSLEVLPSFKTQKTPAKGQSKIAKV